MFWDVGICQAHRETSAIGTAAVRNVRRALGKAGSTASITAYYTAGPNSPNHSAALSSEDGLRLVEEASQANLCQAMAVDAVLHSTSDATAPGRPTVVFITERTAGLAPVIRRLRSRGVDVLLVSTTKFSGQCDGQLDWAAAALHGRACEVTAPPPAEPNTTPQAAPGPPTSAAKMPSRPLPMNLHTLRGLTSLLEASSNGMDGGGVNVWLKRFVGGIAVFGYSQLLAFLEDAQAAGALQFTTGSTVWVRPPSPIRSSKASAASAQRRRGGGWGRCAEGPLPKPMVSRASLCALLELLAESPQGLSTSQVAAWMKAHMGGVQAFGYDKPKAFLMEAASAGVCTLHAHGKLWLAPPGDGASASPGPRLPDRPSAFRPESLRLLARLLEANPEGVEGSQVVGFVQDQHGGFASLGFDSLQAYLQAAVAAGACRLGPGPDLWVLPASDSPATPSRADSLSPQTPLALRGLASPEGSCSPPSTKSPKGAAAGKAKTKAMPKSPFVKVSPSNFPQLMKYLEEYTQGVEGGVLNIWLDREAGGFRSFGYRRLKHFLRDAEAAGMCRCSSDGTLWVWPAAQQAQAPRKTPWPAQGGPRQEGHTSGSPAPPAQGTAWGKSVWPAAHRGGAAGGERAAGPQPPAAKPWAQQPGSHLQPGAMAPAWPGRAPATPTVAPATPPSGHLIEPVTQLGTWQGSFFGPPGASPAVGSVPGLATGPLQPPALDQDSRLSLPMECLEAALGGGRATGASVGCCKSPGVTGGEKQQDWFALF